MLGEKTASCVFKKTDASKGLEIHEARTIKTERRKS